MNMLEFFFTLYPRFKILHHSLSTNVWSLLETFSSEFVSSELKAVLIYLNKSFK